MQQPDWLDREEYPFTSSWWQVNGVRQHYIDVGQGDPVVFVHGTPSWSFDFRHVIRLLSATHRCIAVDHIGFGLSDKPTVYDYSTQRHAETLSRFIDHKGLSGVTLVLHDFGGPIGMKYAIDHADNIRQIIILNSWIGSSENDPEFERFSKILRSPLLPFLYHYLNFSPRFLLPQSFGDKKLSRKLLKQFTSPFQKSSERHGPLAFARSLLHDQPWFEELWQDRVVLHSTPMLLIWGLKDKFVTTRYLDRFMEGFPLARVVRLETCGHFPQEEEPELVAGAIADFVKAQKGNPTPTL